MRDLLFVPIYHTFLEGGMPASQEWHRYVEGTPYERPTGSRCARDGASLPLALGKWQGMSF